MDLGLEGRRVVVGGASRGIGLAVARGFLAEEADVALLARDADRLAAAAQQLRESFPGRRVAHRAVDLRDEVSTLEAVEACTRELGGLDCAVASAGSGVGRTGWELPTEEWRRLLDQNLTTAASLAGAAAANLGQGGAIALIASIAGLGHVPAPMPYGAAKAAVVRYGKDLAWALADCGVRVNVVAPGNVMFPGGRWEELQAADPEGVDDYIAREVPLRRFGDPDEIAAAVVFLCSARSAFTTGTCLTVDGGQLRD